MGDGLIASISIDVANYLCSNQQLKVWPESLRFLLDYMTEDDPWLHALPVLSCIAVGGESSYAIPVAAAWTMMYHAANVIDDVQDGDFMLNRGTENPESAVTISLSWIFAAIQTLNDSDLGDLKKARTLDIFAQSGFDSSWGQYQSQKGHENQPQKMDPLENYWGSVIRKSGSIFRAGTAGGAAVGTDSGSYIDALGDFGVALGVIRQVIDDCRDVWMDVKDEKTVSPLPMLLYRLIGNQSDQIDNSKPLSVELVENNTLEKKARLLTEAGIPEIVTEILLEWRRRALDSLQVISPSQAKEALVGIVEQALSFPGSKRELWIVHPMEW